MTRLSFIAKWAAAAQKPPIFFDRWGSSVCSTSRAGFSIGLIRLTPVSLSIKIGPSRSDIYAETVQTSGLRADRHETSGAAPRPRVVERTRNRGVVGHSDRIAGQGAPASD